MSGDQIVQYVDYQGNRIACYGVLQDSSNFSVVCDDEYDDAVWCNADPVTGNAFDCWDSVVERLQPHFESAIQEISAV